MQGTHLLQAQHERHEQQQPRWVSCQLLKHGNAIFRHIAGASTLCGRRAASSGLCMRWRGIVCCSCWSGIKLRLNPACGSIQQHFTSILTPLPRLQGGVVNQFALLYQQ